MQYQYQNSPQTLRQGLAEYYAAFPMLDRFEETDERTIARVFMAHDAVHVLTGMDISAESEVILDSWQFWATLPGETVWDSVRITREIFADSEFSGRIKTIITASSPWQWLFWTLTCSGRCCRAIAQSFRMTRKWRLFNYPQYLDMPLVQIRQEYNIRVMQEPPALSGCAIAQGAV